MRNATITQNTIIFASNIWAIPTKINTNYDILKVVLRLKANLITQIISFQYFWTVINHIY